MKQNYELKISDGQIVRAVVNISMIKQWLAQPQLLNVTSPARAVKFEYYMTPTPEHFVEHREWAMGIYGAVAKSLGAPFKVKGFGEVPGTQEGWHFDAQGEASVCEIDRKLTEEPHPLAGRIVIHLDELQRLHRLCQEDAQNLHVLICQRSGLHDFDEIVKRWNAACPLAPWNCAPDECRGEYVDQLTDIALDYIHSIAVRDGILKLDP